MKLTLDFSPETEEMLTIEAAKCDLSPTEYVQAMATILFVPPPVEGKQSDVPTDYDEMTRRIKSQRLK